MTSIFTYPLQNAWVLVSDKLEANQTESQRIDSGYETFPDDIKTKIAKNKQYVYGLAGRSNDIQKITGLLDSSISERFAFDQFRNNVLQLYGNNVSDIDVELLLIDSKAMKAYKILIRELPEDISKSEISSIENGYIGSGASRIRAKYQTTPMLEALKSEHITLDKIKGILLKSVIALEILARSDYQFTGHPAVYGSNIFIIFESKILDYKILPKRYLCKENADIDWSELEELNND